MNTHLHSLILFFSCFCITSCCTEIKNITPEPVLITELISIRRTEALGAQTIITKTDIESDDSHKVKKICVESSISEREEVCRIIFDIEENNIRGNDGDITLTGSMKFDANGNLLSVNIIAGNIVYINEVEYDNSEKIDKEIVSVFEAGELKEQWIYSYSYQNDILSKIRISDLHAQSYDYILRYTQIEDIAHTSILSILWDRNKKYTNELYTVLYSYGLLGRHINKYVADICPDDYICGSRIGESLENINREYDFNSVTQILYNSSLSQNDYSLTVIYDTNFQYSL